MDRFPGFFYNEILKYPEKKKVKGLEEEKGGKQMKKRISALVLSAVLCVTAIPMTGWAAEFSDRAESEDSSRQADLNWEEGKESTEGVEKEAGDESLDKDAGESSWNQDNTDQDNADLELGEDPELTIGDLEQSAGETAKASADEDVFQDGAESVPEKGNLTLSHEGILQEGAICPKETFVVLSGAWEDGLISLVENGGSVLDISGLSIPADQISDVLMLFLNRHPEYYWLSFDSCDVEKGMAVTLYEKEEPSGVKNGSSLFGSSSVEEATEKALSVIQPEMSCLERALALHDYIALNTEYDYENLQNGTIPDSDYTIEGVLVNGTGVCQGYALTYQYLLDKIGIESRYVGSQEMNHGWNLINIENEWYHVDVTWDDPVWDQLGRVRHLYFLISDSAISGLPEKHYGWKTWGDEDAEVPKAVSDRFDNYFWKNVDTGIWYYEGRWYYMEIDTSEGSDQTLGIVQSWSYTGAGPGIAFRLEMELKWPYVGNDNYYWGNSAKTVLYNGWLFVSGPDAIYRINVKYDDWGALEPEKVADVKYKDRYIYGLAFVNGSFWITLQESPNAKGKVTPVKLELGEDVTVEPTPTPIPIVTPTGTPKLTPTAIPTETPELTPTAIPTETPETTPTAIPTETPEPTGIPKVTPTIRWKACNWISSSSAELTFSSNVSGSCYYELVYNEAESSVSTKSSKISVTANKDFKIVLRNMKSNNKPKMYLLFVPKDGTYRTMRYKLTLSGAPEAKPTVTPAATPKVTESVVKGLESPLKFYPNKFYPFTVTGAGTRNTKPKEGNIKWVPIYWSMSSDPSETQRNTVWQIGTTKGIKTAGTYNLYIFFQRYVYRNSKWKSTDMVRSATYQFKSAALSQEKLSTPVLAGTSNSSAGIVLKWKKVSNASGYKIYRKTGSSSKWTYIAMVTGSGTLVYTDGSAKAGSTYTYTVRAYKGSTLSAYNKTGSTIVRLTAPAQYAPASKAADKLTVSWKKASSASGYQIQYAASRNFSGAKTVSTTALTKTFSGLKKGSMYYTRVRTYKKVNGKTYYSAWSTGKSVKIKK